MSIRQLSVFVENKTGHLAAALGILAGGDVNVLSFTIADTVDYGILRLIVADTDRAKAVLEAADYAVVEHSVVAAVMPDRPGVLAGVASLVAASDIDIEYIYLGGRDTLLLKAEECGRLEDLLQQNGFRVLRSDEV
jgi:hypothetical protein